MRVPSELRQSIVQVLTSLPNMQDHSMQRSLAEGAGLDSELLQQIRFGDPSRQFVELLVAASIQYGFLRDGKTALEAILIAAKTYVGQAKRDLCDRLIHDLQAGVSHETIPGRRQPIVKAVASQAEQTRLAQLPLSIPHELSEAFTRQEVILFVGSDLSAYAGLPSLIDMMRPLAQSIQARWPADERDVTPEYLMRLAQHYENQRGRHALIMHVQNFLQNPASQSLSLYRLIGSLPLKIIFTTAYDDMFQRTLQQDGGDYDAIVEEADIPFGSEQRLQIVKLCGDVRRPKSIVISRQDFATYQTTHARFVGRLRHALENKTPLFLGYSLQDPFFNQIWDTVSLEFEELRRWGYAVLFAPDPIDSTNFHHRKVHVIRLAQQNLSKALRLEQWLTDLIKMIRASGEAGR